MKTLFKILLAVLLLSVSINAQRGAKDGLKREALSHMNVGRYGEAIDLFNKYVSANAQEIDGYILRGLCFEKRGQYWDAITDFRKAKRLDNSSVEAITNLNRVIRIFHQILYKKIEGHEREIAINPSNPFNYLEIGKSYRYLEEWQTAEVWYDRYLVLDPNASADEIIRYAEVLTENKHISKGEKILQIWVDKYPSDWRLLSRLGWFRIWLGKHKQAEPVFVKALSIKPFFKEAQDGLDIVKKEGYMRPDVDGWREYPIDRYIRILALNPDDDETRFTLITELKKVNRVEEAYQNLLFLKNKYEGTDRYDQLYIEITSLRHDINSRKLADKLNELERGGADVQLIVSIAHTYGDLDRNDEGIDFVNHYIDAFSESRELVLVLARLHRQNKNYFAAVEILQEFVEKNPYDKEIILTIADSYASDYAFDDAIAILKKYLEIYPENQELDVRYKLATYSAWNYDWEDARDQLNILLENDPQNINYKLLRSQIIVWTVETDNFDLADKYLNDILTKEPDHLLGLISMASLKIWQRDFDTAAEKIDIAKKAHGERDEINEVQKFYDGRIALEEEKKKLDILKQAGDRLEDGDCEGALEAYDEYLELETEPSNQIYIEYASLKLCIKKFDEALSIYERLLAEGPSVDVELARAKAYLWSGDFTSAQTEFVKLLESDPKNTELILLLADSYFGNLSYSKAVNLYESYLETTVDTSQNSFVRSRLNGMPPYGLFGGIAGIFNYFIPFGYRIIPIASYYKDNQSSEFLSYGSRFQIDLLKFTLGAQIINSNLIVANRFTQSLAEFGFTLGYNISEKLSVGGGMGLLNIQGENRKSIGNLFARYYVKDKYDVNFLYDDNDARITLAAPLLIYTQIDAYRYLLSGKFNIKKPALSIFSKFQYFNLSDGNIGNDFLVKIGKDFQYDTKGGYEFYFIDFGFSSNRYYSQNEFYYHTLWGEWTFHKDEEVEAKVGGKLGYAPLLDITISEITGTAQYQVAPNLVVSAQAAYGNNFRYDTGYKYLSAYLSAYFSLE